MLKSAFAHFRLPRGAFMVAVSAACLLRISSRAADGPVAAVQRALQVQDQYLAEPNGVVDEATRAALRRFQTRTGLPITGEIDTATLQALQNGSAATAPKLPPRNAPAVVPPPARPAARAVAQSDRDFLASVESAAPPAMPAAPTLTVPKAPPAPALAFPKAAAVPTPIARTAPKLGPAEPVATIPAAPAMRSSVAAVNAPPATPLPAPVAPRAAPVPRAATPPPVAVAAPSAPVSFARPIAALPPSAPASITRAPAAGAGAISDNEARRFVESFLQVAEGPSPDLELAFYGDPVDYFDSGRVPRKFVEYDQRSYYRRWPARDFTLLTPPVLESATDDGAVLRYRVRYALGSGSQKATGQSENTLHVQRSPDGLKIVGIHERRVAE